MIDLDDLEAKARAATPGPWTVVGDEDFRSHGIDDHMIVACQVAPGDDYICNLGPAFGPVESAEPRNNHNARFIAAANPAAILDLVAEVRRLRGENEGLRRSAEMACIEPADDCACAGCEYAREAHREPEPDGE